MRFKFSKIPVLSAACCLFFGAMISGQRSEAGDEQESKSQRAFHWLELKSSVNGQALGSSRLGRLNLDYALERDVEVERETIQVDSQTVRTIERAYRRDANGRRQLQDVTEVEQRTFSDGRVEAVQTKSTIDVNGRMQVWRQQRQETRNLGDDRWETSSTVLKPGTDGRLETVYRIQQTEHRDADDVVRMERVVEEQDLNNRWNVIEQRSATVEERAEETIQQETVYERGPFGELSLKSQVSSIEWQDKDGGIHRTIDTYQPDSRGEMELVERIELKEVTLDNGNKQSIQELQTRSSAQGELQVVERIAQDLTRARTGDTVENVTIERRDVYGKISIAENISRTRTEEESGPGKKTFTSKPK